MGKIRSITPSFDNASQKIRISAPAINEIQRGYLINDHDFYQAAFNMFEYMTLTENQTYRLTSFAASSSTWNMYKSCIGYKTNGSLETNTREFKPCLSYDMKQWCHDELVGSCMDHFLTASGSTGDLALTEEGTRVWNQFTEELIYSSSAGLTNTLAVGNLYQQATMDMIDENLSVEEKKTALAQLNTESCRGWVTMLDDLSQDGYGWLNCADELFGENDFDNVCNYGGDFLEIIEALICKAKPKLKTMINGGNRGRVGSRRIQAQIWVSDSFYQAAIQAFDKECAHLAQNKTKIRQETISAAGESKDVYYYKNMPIIPICDVNALDDKLVGDTHFIGIFASGVVQLGSSFGRIGQDLQRRDTAVMLQRNNNITPIGANQNGEECFEYGKSYMLSHALTDVRLVDPTCAVAAFAYFE